MAALSRRGRAGRGRGWRTVGALGAVVLLYLSSCVQAQDTVSVKHIALTMEMHHASHWY